MRAVLVVLNMVIMAFRYSRALQIPAFATRRAERWLLHASQQQPPLTPITHNRPSLNSNYVTLAQRRRNQQRLLATLEEEEVDPGVVEGTNLRIVKYPHPALRTPNVDVTEEELKDGSMAQLAKEMFMMMYASQGVGLAAPQVGVNKRLMIYNESGDPKRWLDEIVLINPKIIEFSESTDVENEGCLSFPQVRGDVTRSKWIKVEALNLKGKKIKRKFVEWEARIFQHEYDHLDGVVFIDRLTEESKEKAQPKLQELIQEFGEGGVL